MLLTFNILALTDDPTVMTVAVPARELDLDSDMALDGPAQVRVELQRLGEKIHIRGTLEAKVQLACARCLNDFVYAVKTDLDLVALPADKEKRPSKVIEDNPEEEDTSVMAYEHDQVELLPEIRSALILAIPMKPLCEETCPGLCPECGLRMDDTHQAHEEDRSDSPFARIKKIWENRAS